MTAQADSEQVRRVSPLMCLYPQATVVVNF